jgi:hypothetical protein
MKEQKDYEEREDCNDHESEQEEEHSTILFTP